MVRTLKPVAHDAHVLTRDTYIPTRPDDYSEYQGPYEVTPSREIVTLATKGHVLTSDMTIKAIPSNYGLVAWNGSALTIS